MATAWSPRPAPAGRSGGACTLLHLAVLRVLAAARAELVQRHAVRIVPLVLLGVIGPLAAVRARQRDEDSIGFLRHLALPSRSRDRRTQGAHPPRPPSALGSPVVLLTEPDIPGVSLWLTPDMDRSSYAWIWVVTPAPTVRPPSRIANRSPSSSATGWISS